MKYRNIIARCSWDEADDPEITLYGDHGSDDILAECHPTVGIELSDASEDSLKEFARNYIDINYKTLSAGIENPQERPLISLSAEVLDFAEQIQAAANYLTEHGREETMEGNWVTEFSELDGMFGLQLGANPMLVKAIGDAVITREEVADFDVDMSTGTIDIDYYTDYCPQMQKEIMVDALIVRPGEAPERISIENELKPFQKLVDGYIEIFPLDNNVIAIVNEEGKLKGLDPNRHVGQDIIAGNMIICSQTPMGEFASLTSDQMEKYEKRFAEPEQFTLDETEGLQSFTM